MQPGWCTQIKSWISLFLLLFVICCLFVYDCISLWFVYFCYLFGAQMSFLFLHGLFHLYPIKRNCVLLYVFCTWVSSFGHAVVFFIPLWFVLFTQSNELCFIVVFVICFVLFWASSCLPYSSLIHPQFLSSIDSNRWTKCCCCCCASLLSLVLSFLFVHCSCLNILTMIHLLSTQFW